MPMYDRPNEANFDNRGIFGFIAIFIGYDPLWNTRDALHHFVREHNTTHGHAVADPSILASFQIITYQQIYSEHVQMYSEHVSNYIRVNPAMMDQLNALVISVVHTSVVGSSEVHLCFFLLNKTTHRISLNIFYNIFFNKSHLGAFSLQGALRPSHVLG